MLNSFDKNKVGFKVMTFSDVVESRRKNGELKFSSNINELRLMIED